MTTPALSRKTLDQLRRRHVEFLEQRLVSDAAREDWRRGFREGYEQLLAMRLREALDPAATARALHAALTTDSVRTLFAPILREVDRQVLDSLRAGESSLGDHVPADARRAIDALLDRPGLVPAALVRKVFEQQVIEDAIHDTLYDALTQFQTTVNPFFAEWGLPSILRRMPIGGSLILASMEAIRTEFDRRLEPEIRKFLAAFSRRATGELTEFFLTRGGDPKVVELRKNLVGFLYSQSLAELLAGVDDEAGELAGLAAEHVLVGLLERNRSGESLQRALEAFLEERGGGTIGQWLEAIGATGRPDLDAWADLLWPHVERALRSAVVRDFLTRVTAEFYDSLAG